MARAAFDSEPKNFRYAHAPCYPNQDLSLVRTGGRVLEELGNGLASAAGLHWTCRIEL